MTEKYTGYALLFGGILLMTAAFFIVFLTFTGVLAPTPIFNTKGVSLDMQSMLPPSLRDLNSLSSTNADQNMQLFSGADLNKSLNLTMTFFLMSFLLMLGYKIASLGIQLLRPIVVKLDENSLASTMLKQKLPPTPQAKS